MESYRRIRSEEPETILVLVQNRKKQADIAKALGRNQSSLLRELAKGLEKRAYNPFLAQRETDKRAAYRKLALKIDAQTWEAINNHLSLRWSPKQIENFLHTGGNDFTVISVSEKTIESYINLHMKGELKKLALAELRQKGNLREKGPEPRGKLPHMTLIDERQGEVDSAGFKGDDEPAKTQTNK